MVVKQGYVYPDELQFFCGYTDVTGRLHPPGEYHDVDGSVRVYPDFP
jgi:hypothetical protein